MQKWLILLIRVVGVLLGLAGAALAGGGFYLITLGGSWFYLPIGLLMLCTGWLTLKRRPGAFWLAWLMFVIVAIWAYWEVGSDFWQLVSRVMIFGVICLVLTALAPQLNASEQGGIKRAPATILSVIVAVGLISTFASMFRPHAQVEAQADAKFPIIHPEAGDAEGKDWPAWGRNLAGDKFAQFDQVNKQNVKDLKVAWTYRTGDLSVDGSEYQVTPIKIDDTLYLCTPLNKVIALDPVTGAERWRFDPKMEVTRGNKGWKRCRGVSYIDLAPSAGADGNSQPTTPQPAACEKRIVSTTNDARLFEVDAKTGKACTDFGDNGFVNLLDGLGDTAAGSYYLTSAPLVADGVIMVGGKLNDNMTVGEASGVVRGYDAVTGKLLWAWDPSRGAEDSSPLPAGEVYAKESPNFWGTASYDPKLGLAYFPTGNQTPDFWTGNRHSYSDEYNDSIVAIELKTGKERWHFRTANTDQFDYDVSSQPILYDLPLPDGTVRPVVIQLTKRGQIFVLDRATGEPVVPVTYKKVPTDAMPGMKVADHQPYSALSVGVEPLKEKDMWGATLFDQMLCRIDFLKMRWEGEWTPLSDQKRTLIWPGYYGGFNWGGGALDARTGTLIVNDIRMAMWGKFIKREEANKAGLVPSTEGEYSEQLGTPWGVERSMFLSPLGTPCFKPPFGSMTAIDLATQKVKWQVPMGSIQDAPIKGIAPGVYLPIGMPTLGGPLVTKGGLTFFHGSLDYYVRALDNDTGEELWRDRLPVGGQGVPMTYVGNDDQQYVVVVAGGATRTGTNKNRGDYVIAYSLKSKAE
ncbi:glucose/quinate/shikimate family [Pseudomonas sp. S60]|uniref:membrane-bound PQQ-dependent dehydrogenase, glucose/quinate/shikimate family n=1 Tax=unclassified Pseudomonas TaxID=196821 RepID=UPI0019131E49|nr:MULTISPECIES: membrane-bound PQQ-dependent dehydrogenase, glucose/quinate/shikimate family [unclassified Pseudomonas]MBK4987693.1 glucose/quinate/shikimate family [Pseudomonas sp. S36]MBK5009475.1 glucose/quinate/shikimate family [Pseudomonas sp. S60]